MSANFVNTLLASKAYRNEFKFIPITDDALDVVYRLGKTKRRCLIVHRVIQIGEYLYVQVEDIGRFGSYSIRTIDVLNHQFVNLALAARHPGQPQNTREYYISKLTSQMLEDALR